MPGIVGIISRKKPTDECQRLVAAMTASMVHEEFYVSGTYSFGELGIHAGWVAHQGSMAAEQVFWNERRDVALVFAGECFIDASDRLELIRKGHDLGHAAGGWLVHLYEEIGERVFVSLNGLFSGLLVDLRHQRAFLFNDRYGIERLYWHEGTDATFFASEAKALLRVLPETRAFDEEGVAQFLGFGCTYNWKTLFRGVQLCPGGALWKITEGECRRGEYFAPATLEEGIPLTESDFTERFAETFERVLPHYFESASKVAISLTGGLDTRMIMASLPKGLHPIAYTFAAESGETLDARIARRLADASGVDHELLRIGRRFFSEFDSYADRTVYITDGCCGVWGAHEIYLHEQARLRAPIRLTGNFGSEILRSSSTFKPVELRSDLLVPDFAKLVADRGEPRLDADGNSAIFAAFKDIPWNLFGCLAAGRSQLTFRTPYLDNGIVELASQAPVEVRQSSKSAVQFIKETSPKLSAICTDRGQLGPDGKLNHFMQRAFSDVTFKLDYFCSEGLPFGLSVLDPIFLECNRVLGVAGLHKFLNYPRWLRGELASFLQDRLAQTQLAFWNSDFLSGMAKNHLSGFKNYGREINAVMTLESVDRLILRAHSNCS